MLKPILIFFFGLFIFQTAKAQKQDTLLYYVKKTGEVVPTKAAADFYILSLPPTDEDRNLFLIKEFAKDGTLEYEAKSLMSNYPFRFQGQFIRYFRNGNRRSLQTFADGTPIGDLCLYYTNGDPYVTESYIPNSQKMFLKECRDTTGKIICENGNGMWIDYDRAFIDMSEGPVVKGLANGEWKGVQGDSVKYTCIFKKGEVLSGIGYDINGKAYPFKKVFIAPKFTLNEGLVEFLNNNRKYPDYALKHKISGLVTVEFTIETDGTIDNINVVNGNVPCLNDEAIREVGLTSASWIPAVEYGIPVSVKYHTMIYFRL